MFELAVWKAWITAWSNVCWNVEPEPLRVALPPEPPDPPEVVDELGLLLLPARGQHGGQADDHDE